MENFPNIIPFHHVLVICDSKDSKHLNLNQTDNFTYAIVDYAADLAKKKLVCKAPNWQDNADSTLTVFIGIGSFDAKNETPLENFQHDLNEFFLNNAEIVRKCHLVYLKPRIRSKTPIPEARKIAKYIQNGYSCFSFADPNVVFLSMDRKPRIVSWEYKKLFENIIEDKSPAPEVTPVPEPEPEAPSKPNLVPGQTVLPENVNVTVQKTVTVEDVMKDKKIVVEKEIHVEKPQEPLIHVHTETESESTSNDFPGETVTETEEEPQEQAHHQPAEETYESEPEEEPPQNNATIKDKITGISQESHNQPKIVTGRYMFHFRGNNFLKECSVKMLQNSNIIGETEKFSKKEYNLDPYFKDMITADFKISEPQGQKLTFHFGDWGQVNITMSELMRNEVFAIKPLKEGKSVGTARVSIGTLKPSTLRTRVRLVGQNFPKISSFYKVFLNSPSEPEDLLIYTSETVSKDSSPQYAAFELYDGRYDPKNDTLNFEFFEDSTFGSKSVGTCGLDYADLRHFTGGFQQDDFLAVHDSKQQEVGRIYINCNVTGEEEVYEQEIRDATMRSKAQSYNMYISCKNLEKESNQIMWNVNGTKGKTEKLSKTSCPMFATPMKLKNTSKLSNFVIEFTNTQNKKEKVEVKFRDILMGQNMSQTLNFGQTGILYLNLVNIEEDEKIRFKIDANQIPVMDRGFIEGNKCDPYFKLSLDEFFCMQSKAQKQTLDASYVIEIPKVRLQNRQLMNLVFWDQDKANKDDVIGTLTFPIQSVFAGQVKGMHVNPVNDKPPKGLEVMRVSVNAVARFK